MLNPDKHTHTHTLSYEERLKKLQLPALTERREEEKEGDIIMLYKCVEIIEKTDVKEYVIPSQTSLRGHRKKLYKKRLKKDVRKYSFPDRAVDKWNALPEVECVKSIHSFKEKNMMKCRLNTGQNELHSIM